MPAQDVIHNAVKNALVKDGWTITDDPYRLQFEDLKLYADLAAERPFAAERGARRIVVEVKSFTGASPVRDFEAALGQYLLYRNVLQLTEPGRSVHLAIPDTAYINFFSRKSIQVMVEQFEVALLVVDVLKQEVVEWKPE